MGPVPSYAMNRSTQPAPIPDERVLELVGEKLAELTGEWRVVPGPLLKGPGAMGVRVGGHSDNIRHVDLEFLLNVDRADLSVVDCAYGLASDPEEAIRQAAGLWAGTTASAVLEFAFRRSTFAGHYGSDTPGGFPGWYAVISGTIGWGQGASFDAMQGWVLDTSPWTELAPVIATGLDRPHLNGVRISVGHGSNFEICEVAINGIRHEPSAAALNSMNWPRTEQMSSARTFLLLVHPAADGHEPG